MAGKPSVLVTRPAGQAAALCHGLEARGFNSHHLPLLELVPDTTPDEKQRLYLSRLDQYRHIIFISANAVRYGMAWIDAARPGEIPPATCHAVGEATAGVLRDLGFTVAETGAQMTSEALLAHPDLQAVAGQRILIVKGHGGRVSLRETLSERGALVDELACYQRRCPDREPGEVARRLADWGIGLILISSGEGLANLVGQLEGQALESVRALPLVVPSPRVAMMASEYGFASVQVADNASDEAMLTAVEQYW